MDHLRSCNARATPYRQHWTIANYEQHHLSCRLHRGCHGHPLLSRATVVAARMDDVDLSRERVGKQHALADGGARVDSESAPHVDWPAIFAGALLASAIGFIMMSFGSGLGLSLVDPLDNESVSIVLVAVTVGLWTTWVVVSSFMAGGYLAGRMRRRAFDATAHEVEVRDGSHGVIVWALGVLVAGYLTASGITSLAGAGVAAVGNVASATTSVVASGAEGVASAGPDAMSYLGDTLLRRDDTDTGGGADSAQSRAEIGRILTRSLQQGEMQESDMTYLVNLVARETGIPAEEAQARVDQAVQVVEETVENAKGVAETTRKTGILAGFLTAALLVISAAAAWWAATMGGKHRDEGTDFSHLTRW